MQCLHPIHLKQDDAPDRIVPCGHCAACLVRLRQEWTYRLREELRVSKDAFFVTLTYDNEHLPIKEFIEQDTSAVFYDACVSKEDVQKFNKRLRKKLSKDGYKTRFYLISEYGPRTLRPHYHGVYFFRDSIDRDYFSDCVSRSWQSPNICVDYVNDERIKYVTEYCLTRKNIPDHLEPNFRIMSNRPGIGYDYVDKMRNWHLADDSRFYAPDYSGNKCNLPRYYREKIYPKEVIENHSALLSSSRLDELNKLFESKGFNYEKWLLDEKAKQKDYEQRTSRFLDKKLKKL